MRPRAIISGGFGDVGYAIATRLAREGYDIVILYHTPRVDQEQRLAALGDGNHTAHSCDFADTEQIEKSLAEIISDGPIAVGIHAAWPPFARKKLIDTTESEFNAQLQEGVIGGFLFFQRLARHMQEHKAGVLVGITSQALEGSSGAMGAYVPAKFALFGVLKKLREELQESGVRVHALAPGFMRAGMNKDLPDRLFEMLAEQSPLETPEDVAEKIIQLITNTASAFSIT